MKFAKWTKVSDWFCFKIGRVFECIISFDDDYINFGANVSITWGHDKGLGLSFDILFWTVYFGFGWMGN